MNQTKPLVAVLGLGRFGNFWSSLLAKEFDVIAWSRNPERACPQGVKKVEFEALFEAEALFLCNAISSMDSVAKSIASNLKPGMVVLDTCSVKLYPLQVLDSIFSSQVEIIGTHPMFGPDSAKVRTQGLPIVLSSFRQSDANYQLWKARFKLLKLKVMEMTPKQHDKEAAYTQGVTHFIGRVLDQMNLKPSEMATSGYATLQKIRRETCNDPWQLFEDLQRLNPYTCAMRQDLHEALDFMLNKVDSLGCDKECECDNG